jgi:hypothetical protein
MCVSCEYDCMMTKTQTTQNARLFSFVLLSCICYSRRIKDSCFQPASASYDGALWLCLCGISQHAPYLEKEKDLFWPLSISGAKSMQKPAKICVPPCCCALARKLAVCWASVPGSSSVQRPTPNLPLIATPTATDGWSKEKNRPFCNSDSIFYYNQAKILCF